METFWRIPKTRFITGCKNGYFHFLKFEQSSMTGNITVLVKKKKSTVNKMLRNLV